MSPIEAEAVAVPMVPSELGADGAPMMEKQDFGSGMGWLNGSEFTLQQWLALPSFDRGLRIIVICIVGLIGYALILLLLGVRPRHFLRAPQ